VDLPISRCLHPRPSGEALRLQRTKVSLVVSCRVGGGSLHGSPEAHGWRHRAFCYLSNAFNAPALSLSPMAVPTSRERLG